MELNLLTGFTLRPVRFSQQNVKGPKDNAVLLHSFDFYLINLPCSCRKEWIRHKILTRALLQQNLLHSKTNSKNPQANKKTNASFLVPFSKTAQSAMTVFTVARCLTTCRKYSRWNECAIKCRCNFSFQAIKFCSRNDTDWYKYM